MRHVHALLSRLRESAPVPVEIHDRVEAEVPLSEYQSSRVLGAALEALRNVERHAVHRRAEVTLTLEDDAWLCLTIANPGPPRNPTSAKPGFGIVRSIQEPLAELGGTGRVEVGSEQTEVVLRWPVHPTPDDRGTHTPPMTDVLKRLGALTRLPPIKWAIAPMLAAQVYLGLTNPWRHQPTIVTVLAVAVGVAATWGLVRLLERGRPSQALLLGLGVLMSAVTAASVWWLGAETLANFQSWQVGFTSVPLALIAFHVSGRALPAVVLPLPVMIGLVAHLSALPLWHAAGSINTAILPLFAGSTAAGLRLGIVRAERRHREVMDLSARTASQEAHQAAVRRHLRHVRTEIVPWLERVADGLLDLDDPATARTARVHGWGARDDLYAPDFFDTDLRLAAAQFRERGGRLVIRPDVNEHGTPPGALELLLTMMRELDGTHTITVSPQAGGPRIVVSPGLAPQWSASAAAGHQVSGDEYATEFRPATASIEARCEA